jgi:hypothetical protein
VATRKQLKRERKRRTHGIERMVPDTAVQETTEKQPSTRGRGRTAKPAANPAHRGRKPVAYPTIWRALKRAPLLAAVWFVLIEFVFKPSGSSTTGNLITTALIGAVMVPAMYLTDRFAYRMAIKRGAPVEDPPTGRFGRPA